MASFIRGGEARKVIHMGKSDYTARVGDLKDQQRTFLLYRDIFIDIQLANSLPKNKLSLWKLDGVWPFSQD